MQAIGVDLGGTNLRLALVDIDGEEASVVREQRCAIGDERDPTSVAKTFANLLEMIQPLPKKIPIGFGVAGMLDREGQTVVNSPNLGWRDEPFAKILKKVTGHTITLENDLSVITWGETRFGAAKGYNNTVVVFIGTGIGGGAVLDGGLYRGGSNAALEIGHIRVVPEGRACRCGAAGCLEAYVGGAHIAEQARENPSDLLLGLVNGAAEEIHAGHVDQAAREGDERATQLIVQGAAFVAGVLGDVTVLLNPDCLVLGGTVWQGCDHLRELIVHLFASLPEAPARSHVKMVEAELPDTAGIFGAADLALSAAG